MTQMTPIQFPRAADLSTEERSAKVDDPDDAEFTSSKTGYRGFVRTNRL